MATRAFFFVVALVLGALAAMYFFDHEEVVPAPIAAAPPPAVVEAPPGVVESVVDAGEESPPLAPINFADGFCSKTGSEQFELRYTPARLVNEFVMKPPAGSEEQVAAIRAGNFQRDATLRRNAAREVATRWPDSLAAQAFLAKEAHGEERLAAIRRARKIAPRDPAMGWAIAEETRHSADLDEAIDGLTAYLGEAKVAGISRLRARLEVARSIQQDYQRESRNGVTVLWAPGTLTNGQGAELASTVDRALDDAAKFTGTSRRGSLTVIVYPSRSELLAVTCAPAWAGGIYDGALRLIAAPTPEGVKASTVRHETLHAQLTPNAPNSPLWFDEGVAQSFDRRDDPPAWRLMVKNKTWIPFSSLNESFYTFEGSDVSLAYAQSYAMVEMMREYGGDDAISIAREALASGADTPGVLARACRRSEVTGADLLAYLAHRLKMDD